LTNRPSHEASDGGDRSTLDRALLTAVLDADVESVRSLIASGADVNACVPISNRGALYMPAGAGNRTPIGIAISERANEHIFLRPTPSTETDDRQREQRAKIKRAALLEIVEELARAGADLNRSSISRLAPSPLLMAARENDTEIIELLLRYGAQPQGTGALHAASIDGHIEAVRVLLAAGVNVNERVNGLTPMQMIQERAIAQTEQEWVLNLGEEFEQMEAAKEKERASRRLQVMEILVGRN
jgi:ankyrin repeat protein